MTDWPPISPFSKNTRRISSHLWLNFETVRGQKDCYDSFGISIDYFLNIFYLHLISSTPKKNMLSTFDHPPKPNPSIIIYQNHNAYAFDNLPSNNIDLPSLNKPTIITLCPTSHPLTLSQSSSLVFISPSPA